MTEPVFCAIALLTLTVLLFGVRRLRLATAAKMRREHSSAPKRRAGGSESVSLPEHHEQTSIPHAPSLPMLAETHVLRWVNGESPPLFPVVPNPIATPMTGAIRRVRTDQGTYVCQTLPTPNGKDYLFYPIEGVPLSEEEMRWAEMRGVSVVITLQNGEVVQAQVPHHDLARHRGWEYDLSRGRDGWGR